MNFGHLDDRLADILSLLSDRRIVLRAGIVTVRYVYHRYVNSWIIHSYKILRLEKESHQTIPEGSVYVLDNEECPIDKETNRVTTAANLFYNSTSQACNGESSKKAASPKKDLCQNSTVSTKMF